MRENARSKLLRGALAAVLACGLMMPTGALAANATAGETASAGVTALAAVTPGAGSFALGDFTIWGVNGDTVTKGDFSYDETAHILTVNTDRQFAIQTPDQSLSDEALGLHAKPVAGRIVIPAGQTARITLAGVGVSGDDALDIQPGGTCHLTLADGTVNSFSTDGNQCAIHNPTGATLTIEDGVANIDADGNPLVPEGGVVPRDATLANGQEVKKGDPLTKLDSDNPGRLLAIVKGNGNAAVIGGHLSESGGNLTINGGIITAKNAGTPGGSTSCGASIGGGGSGNGTGLDEWITINGGRVNADAYKVSYGHGAAIGGGNAAATGNIRINGGYTISSGPDHGSGFGAGCGVLNSSAYQIIITGGTLLPSSVEHPYSGCGDIGAPGAEITISGGSVGNGRPGMPFNFVGNAHNEKGEPIRMVEIDLVTDVGENPYEVTRWQLKVDGDNYDYGAPAEFDKGHLYLWLPEKVIESSEVTVEFTYKNTDKLDENGNPTEVTPLPLFRPPGTGSDSKLRRYADFNLPEEYLAKLKKYYDGEPFTTYAISDENPLPTLEEIGTEADGTPIYRELTDPSTVTYKYQLYDKRDGTPLGPEVSANDDGSPLTTMPTDAGTMKFTMTSEEFSSTEGFKENYWGHRATGWCEILPTNSTVALVEAQWVEDSAPGSDHHDSDKELQVNARISRGAADPAGVATKTTCAAPEGYVQLYVDGKAVGDPIEILFEDKPAASRAATAEGKKNAERKGDDASGHYTDFTYVFTPADADFLVPDATSDGNHEVSVQYLPPNEGDAAPANYLASVNPAEDPDGVESDTVAISPIDPEPTVEPEDAPDGTKVEVSPDPEPADPAKPNEKEYHGSIETVYQKHGEGEPNPGRVTLKLDTPSSGPVTVTTADGRIIEADILRDESGAPVRDADGKITLVVDPEAVGETTLTVSQAPNGAYTGTTFVFDVTVKPNPEIAPDTSVSKSVKNLTHPDGPTQPGDRLRYTVTAANAAEGSGWNDVALSDELPACLVLDEASVRLANPSAPFDGALSQASAPKLGEYSLAAANGQGRRVLTAPAGSIYGAGTAVLTFECTVAGDAAGRGVSSELENVATAEGTRTDPDDPDRELPENPDPSKPALPPGPATVAPGDPAAAVTKTVENVASPGAKVTRVGDVLRYAIELSNSGDASTCLLAATVSDPLPAGMEPKPGSIAMALPDGTTVPVDDAAYDAASRTIAVTAGDLWGGEKVVLSFEVVVGEGALGADNANVAFAHGTVPSVGPDSVPADPDPGKPAAPPSDGDGDAIGTTPGVEPPVLVGLDPAEGDIAVDKAAENASRGDGTTRVGDVVRYTVRLRNDGPATSWMDAVIRDAVPVGVEPVSGSVSMTLPDGTAVAVDDAAYDHETRVLAVAAGHLYGGQEVVLAFDALVTEEALGADIGNVAEALGVPPSQWDPDGEHPVAGQPFDPPAGWAAIERESEMVGSQVAYPPGTDSEGGVLPADRNENGDGAGPGGDGKGDEPTTIKKTRLAQTGDELAAGFALGAALATLAAAALLIARRRMRPRR